MSESAKRIIVSGDILRPSVGGGSSQNINIVWLYHLLSYQLGKGSGLPVERVTWGGGFDTHLFYKLQGLQVTIDDWLILQGSTVLSPAALDYVYECYKDSCVVGFELPKILIEAFDRLGIPYIDLIIHPIRFLSDIFFGVRTNSAKFAQVLNLFAVCENPYYETAGRHKAKISRKSYSLVSRDSVLFVGQTEIDRSRVSNGRLVSFCDYEDEISAVFKESDSIFFKPHPYSVDVESDFNFLKRFGAVKLSDENVYKFLSSDNLSLVVGLSSSVIFEARYWGVSSRYLLGNPFKLTEDSPEWEPCALSAYIPIFSSVLNVCFWERVFGSSSRVLDSYFLAANSLRNSLGVSWGYDFLEEDS